MKPPARTLKLEKRYQRRCHKKQKRRFGEDVICVIVERDIQAHKDSQAKRREPYRAETPTIPEGSGNIQISAVVPAAVKRGIKMEEANTASASR